MKPVRRIVAALFTLASVGAFAQSPDPLAPEEPYRDVPTTPPAYTAVPPPAYTTPEDLRPVPVDNRPRLFTRIGMSADVGGGVLKFVNQGLNEITDTGGSWTGRLVIGTRSYVGGEVAYIGTANQIRTLGLDDRAILLSNGVEGLLRVNAGIGDWQPYAVAGYTYRRFEVRNSESNTSAVADTDNDSEIPVGIGLAYRFRGLVADARFTVHPSVASDLLPSSNTNPLAVSLNGKVGFEF